MIRIVITVICLNWTGYLESKTVPENGQNRNLLAFWNWFLHMLLEEVDFLEGMGVCLHVPLRCKCFTWTVCVCVCVDNLISAIWKVYTWCTFCCQSNRLIFLAVFCLCQFSGAFCHLNLHWVNLCNNGLYCLRPFFRITFLGPVCCCCYC